MAVYQSFVAFDTETTGLDSGRDQIVELAGLKFDLEEIDGKLYPRVIGRFEEFVNPGMYIPEEASKINGITDAMVADARPIQEVLPDFIRFCGQSTVLVAHNAPFDIGFLRAAIDKHKLSPLKNPILDSLRISRKIMNEAPSHQLGELAKRLRRELKLQLNSDQLHRALYDCEVLAQVVIALLRRHFLHPDFEMTRFTKVIESVHGSITFMYK
jgi:DNA polymerase III subunit epsilon